MARPRYSIPLSSEGLWYLPPLPLILLSSCSLSSSSSSLSFILSHVSHAYPDARTDPYIDIYVYTTAFALLLVCFVLDFFSIFTQICSKREGEGEREREREREREYTSRNRRRNAREEKSSANTNVYPAASIWVPSVLRTCSLSFCSLHSEYQWGEYQKGQELNKETREDERERERGKEREERKREIGERLRYRAIVRDLSSPRAFFYDRYSSFLRLTSSG